MKFTAGEIVEIIPGSRYDGQSKGTSGKITWVSITTGIPYNYITWSNGYRDAYMDEDIQLVGPSNRESIHYLIKG
jgi:hypothetical protein